MDDSPSQHSSGGLSSQRFAARSVCALLITITFAFQVGRLTHFHSTDVHTQLPFFGANDSSQWATVCALGDEGTYVLDHICFDASGDPINGWHTRDLVQHRGEDGNIHYYSSNPTLLPMIMAGEYWLIRDLTSATFDQHTFFVTRILLALTNLLPLVLAQYLLLRMIERHTLTDWALVFCAAMVCFGTFMTTFAVTLNNYLVSAVSLTVALSALLPVWYSGERAWWRFTLGGLSLGFLIANELPALSVGIIVVIGLALKDRVRVVVALLPSLLLVGVCAIATNIIAHGSWRTPDAHLRDRRVVATVPSKSNVSLIDPVVAAGFVQQTLACGLQFEGPSQLEQLVRGERWILCDGSKRSTRSVVINWALYDSEGAQIGMRPLGKWIDYDGSDWALDNVRNHDRGERSSVVYAFNVILGHHGLLSLTPAWCFSAFGCTVWMLRGNRDEKGIATMIAIVTIAVLAYYLVRPQIERDYEGSTCCFRQMIWLTPLWLLSLAPALDILSQSVMGRAIGIATLFVSVFSSHYSAGNPWSSPWVFDCCVALGILE